MIHLSRLSTQTPRALALMAGVVFVTPAIYAAGVSLAPAVSSSELLLSSAAQGYLGVGISDVDGDRASVLKLKEARGAEIITIDQDAPAAKAGLKIHDVVIQMNGQRVEGIEQFRRMLRETPPGRTVSLVAMRDGQVVNLSAQLADRATIAKDVIVGLDDLPSIPDTGAAADLQSPGPTSGGPGKRSHYHVNSFMEPFGRSRYYVGVDVQPLPTGLADYFGVRGGSGLLVGNVFPNSPGAAAGIKAADVIQKVNGQPIVTPSDWERAIRLNHGKQVQVTVVRDKKEQTLNMVAGQLKNSSQLLSPETNLPGPATMAELRGSLADLGTAAIADQIGESMRGAGESIQGIDTKSLREMAEQAGQGIDVESIRKVLEQSGHQLQEGSRQFEEQMQELRQSLQNLRLGQMD